MGSAILVCPGELGRPKLRNSRARPIRQILFELVAEFFYDRDSRHRRRIAKRAEGSAEHVFPQVANYDDVIFVAHAIDKAGENLLQPGCALAARDAPATAFMLI